MRIIYIRNTHDEKGKYRGDEYFGKMDFTKMSPSINTDEDYERVDTHNKEIEDQQLFFGVHTFTKNEMTFEEIYQETFKLLNGGALCGTYNPKDPKLTIEGHLKALAFMVEHNLVRVEIRVA